MRRLTETARGISSDMSERELDPATAESMEEEPDFAEEHSSPTLADEQDDQVNTEPDESVPEGEGGDGGMDPR
jgi:hypothetical protein